MYSIMCYNTNKYYGIPRSQKSLKYKYKYFLFKKLCFGQYCRKTDSKSERGDRKTNLYKCTVSNVGTHKQIHLV